MEEVSMMETTRPSEKVISAILNCVCPECGGPISLEVNEFRCHGLCGKDWRPFGIVYSLSRSIRQQGEHRTRLGLFTRYQERLLRGISFGGSLSAETSPNALGVGGC